MPSRGGVPRCGALSPTLPSRQRVLTQQRASLAVPDARRTPDEGAAPAATRATGVQRIQLQDPRYGRTIAFPGCP